MDNMVVEVLDEHLMVPTQPLLVVYGGGGGYRGGSFIKDGVVNTGGGVVLCKFWR